MSKLNTESDCVEHFLSKVLEQIKCKPVRAEIESEIRDHIEDSAFEHMDKGESREMATEKAVKQMGDPAMIGVELNETHSIQKPFLIYALAGVSVLFGVISNLSYGYEIAYSYYFLWGIVVLLAMMTFGYRIIVKHTKMVSLFGGILLLILCSRRILLVLNEDLYFYHGSIMGVSFGYNVIFLLVPIFAVTLYRRKNDKLIKLFLPFLLILLPVVIQKFYFYDSFVISSFAIFILGAIITYMVLAKGYFAIGRKKATLLGIGCFAIILTTFIAVFSVSYERFDGTSFSILEESITLMVNPKEHATSAAEDGYNGVMIKDLLSKAEFVGEVQLTKEDMMDYGTGEWYFDLEEQKNEEKYLHYDINDVTLENILPQHYLNNYRVAYVILKYGWCAGILFLAELGLIVLVMLRTTMRIQNSLGFSLALSGSVLITLQMIFYILGNFGHQFGKFCNLPFISEGTMSIIVNMILLGLIISAYRYDRVIGAMTKKRWVKLKV